jgi:imidazolonepropionase-like amidohydrolase
MHRRLALVAVWFWLVLACNLSQAADLALTGARIYPSPTGQVIENGTVLVHDGRISAVGPAATIPVPHDATVIDCKGLVVTSGLWNSHVHILLPGLLHAEKLSASQLNSQLEGMLTRWGFTTIFDIASVLDNTTLIRRRIESGEVRGPRILTVGEPFWVKGGTPIYVKGFLEANHINMPEVESSAQAVARVKQQIHDGADGIKIFAGSIERDSVLVMPLDLARAIVMEAHRNGKPVFSHPSNIAGIEVSIDSGVDILAHPVTQGEPWKMPLVERIIAAHMALSPTLTLLDVEARKAGASKQTIDKTLDIEVQQVKLYSVAGGEVLFGTDAGYIDQFDTTEEFTLMGRAGMTFQQILASLTTNPAHRFGYAIHSGIIAKGMEGDLAVLEGDPAKDVTAFSKVLYTIRGGKVIYSKP